VALGGYVAGMGSHLDDRGMGCHADDVAMDSHDVGVGCKGAHRDRGREEETPNILDSKCP